MTMNKWLANDRADAAVREKLRTGCSWKHAMSKHNAGFSRTVRRFRILSEQSSNGYWYL